MAASRQNGESFTDPISGAHYPMSVLVTYTGGRKETVSVENETDLLYLAHVGGIDSLLPITRTARASSAHLRVQ